MGNEWRTYGESYSDSNLVDPPDRNHSADAEWAEAQPHLSSAVSGEQTPFDAALGDNEHPIKSASADSAWTEVQPEPSGSATGYGHSREGAVTTFDEMQDEADEKKRLTAMINQLVEEVADTKATLTQSIADLSRDLQENQRFADLFAKAHEEVTMHRQGINRTLLKPVFLDILRLYDYFESRAASAEEGAPTKADYLYALHTVEDVLDRNGVEAFPDTLNTPVDRKRHTVISTQLTPEKDLDNTVARSVAKGFEYEGKAIRFEKVIAWKYQPYGKESNEHLGQPVEAREKE